LARRRALTYSVTMISYEVLLDERRSLSGRGTEFRFIGFQPEHIARFRADLEALAITDVAEPASVIADAFLAPMHPRGPNSFGGGVFGANGRPSPKAQVRRHEEGVVFGLAGEPFPSAPAAHHIADAVYGGVLFDGYGHIVLESLARLSPEALASPLPILFHANRERPSSLPVFAEMLAALGIDPARVRFVDEVTRVARLVVPPPSIVIGERIDLGRVRALLAALPAPAPGAGRPVMLSRSALPAVNRKAFGEEALEASLAPFADIVHPQALDFTGQLAAVNATTRLAGFIGSQMHNLLFHAGAAPLDVVYFCTRRAPRTYLQIDLLLGGLRTYVNVADHGAAFEFGAASPYLVRTDLAAQGLRAAGFVPPGFDVPPAGGDEAAFYRTWTERLVRMKLVRPARYWTPADAEAQFAATVAAYRPRMARILADPRLASLVRDAAEATFRKQGAGMDPALAGRFLAAIFTS
jgi:glycosyl transferase family 61